MLIIDTDNDHYDGDEDDVDDTRCLFLGIVDVASGSSVRIGSCLQL